MIALGKSDNTTIPWINIILFYTYKAKCRDASANIYMGRKVMEEKAGALLVAYS